MVSSTSTSSTTTVTMMTSTVTASSSALSSAVHKMTAQISGLCCCCFSGSHGLLKRLGFSFFSFLKHGLLGLHARHGAGLVSGTRGRTSALALAALFLLLIGLLALAAGPAGRSVALGPAARARG